MGISGTGIHELGRLTMGMPSKLFGSSTTRAVDPTHAQDLLRSGALQVDGREQAECDAGHAPKDSRGKTGTLA